MNNLENLFQSPSAAYRGKPFWSWNGKLEKDELLRQIQIFKEMGMGGYFCHSRIGLVTEYLGKEWFELINACADKGQSLGLETWLYDEDRWPSGIAGGKVTQDPDNRMKFIRLSIEDGNDFVYDDNTVAAFTVSLDGYSFTEKTRLGPDSPHPRRTVLKFMVEEMVKETSCNGSTYLDTMKRRATEQFLQETHEKYREHCGDRFGTEIYGIFTDEPHRGAVMAGFGNSNPGGEYLIPYTDSLFADFYAAYGYDLRDFLPELFLWPNGEKVSPVKWQYMELIQRLFAENFLSPIQDWCRLNRIQFTGHMLHEDSLTAQTCMLGSVMRAYEYMDVPGVDVLMEHNYCFWIVKQLQSAARQLGKPWLLSELYGATGWQFDFEGHKAVGDWQALFGINLRCHHLSWYSMQGEGKRDYPASISYQSAWYPDYSYIEDYFARLHVLLSQGEPLCDLLIVYPVESLWCRIYPKWSWQLQTLDPEVQKLEQIYEDTFHLLCGARVDFDYGDEDYLHRMGRVEEQDGIPVLRVGKAVYKSVLVTGMLNMRKSTLDLLYEFAQKGGQVVFGDSPPCYIDAIPSNAAAELPAVYTNFDHILDTLQTKPYVTVRDKEGRPIPDIYAQLRRDGDRTIAVLMNISRWQAFRGVTVAFAIGGYCEKWDVRTGTRTLLAQGDPLSFQTDFEAAAELCLVITEMDEGLRPALEGGRKTADIPCGKAFSYRLHEPNVCLLNFVDYRINDEPPVCGKDILEADKEIRTCLGLPQRGGQMLQPWFTGEEKEPALCSLRLDFHFYVEDRPEELRLAMETPEEFDLLVNGTPDAAAVSGDFWVDPCFRILKISPQVLRPGQNTITLLCRFHGALNLEALYLLGHFGVTLSPEGNVLTKPPETLAVGDITEQGFPFYGAGVSYLLPVPDGISGRTELYTEDFEAALLLATDGKRRKPIWSKPYRADVTELLTERESVELQYILTRANTFGARLGPDGAGGSPYHLLPQGMVSEVWLAKYEPDGTL